MGIGFVVFAWAIILGVLSIFGSIGLAVLVALLTRGVTTGRRKAIIVAALLPFCVWGFLGFAVFGYSAWCIAVRDVDPGFGDGFWVPLAHGYYLQMIDTEEHPFITGPDGPNIELFPDLSGVQLDKQLVLGSTNDANRRFFLINTATRDTRQFPNREALKAAARDLGVAQVRLESPQGFYWRRRFTAADLAAIALIVIVPAWVGLTLSFRLWRLRQTGRGGGGGGK
jgi:hypothetical protein